jgi:hypothetical protein
MAAYSLGATGKRKPTLLRRDSIDLEKGERAVIDPLTRSGNLPFTLILITSSGSLGRTWR